MNKNQNTKEKICTFYTSDYHFEMIILPYISRKLQENKEVIILTENDLEKTVNKVVSNINLKNEKKEKILNLNWKNEDFIKFKKINENTKKQKNMIIFIKGKENYIHNVNKNIEKWIENNVNIKVIDCYEVEDIANRINQVINNYDSILNTQGKIKINRII